MPRRFPARLELRLIVSLTLLLPVLAPAAADADLAGHVEAVIGRVYATDGNDESRRLEKDAPVYAGDTIATPRNGYVKIRYLDEASMSIRPRSELRIDDYRFRDTDEPRRKSFFSLIKGGFRTISGLIGRADRLNYRVNTPIATVGIRGTEYALRVCSGSDCIPPETNAIAVAIGFAEAAPEGLYGEVQAGAVSTTNNAGESVFGEGQSFYVADPDSAAEQTETSGFVADDFVGELAEQAEAENDPHGFAGGDSGGGGGGGGGGH